MVFFLVFFVAISLVISSSSWSLFLFCVLSVTASAFPALAVLVSALIDACVHDYIGIVSLPSSLLRRFFARNFLTAEPIFILFSDSRSARDYHSESSDRLTVFFKEST